MLRKNDELSRILPQSPGVRLVCHCQADPRCHADSTTTVYTEVFPEASDREDTTAACLREEPESDDGSTADEGAPARGAGWVGTRKPVQIGSGYTRRDTCDGQSLAPPGRWSVERRTYPEDDTWRLVADLHTDFSHRVGTPAFLTSLALGKISECPFSSDSIQTLLHSVIRGLAARGLSLTREEVDPQDM